MCYKMGTFVHWKNTGEHSLQMACKNSLTTKSLQTTNNKRTISKYNTMNNSTYINSIA